MPIDKKVVTATGQDAGHVPVCSTPASTDEFEVGDVTDAALAANLSDDGRMGQ